MGAPKTDLETIFRITLTDFPWGDHGLKVVNDTGPDAEWANRLSVELAWHVRNRVDDLVCHIKEEVDRIL
jgi:hypothetical protein